MAMPSPAIQRTDLSLSYGEFNPSVNRKGFIGLQVLPAVGVDNIAGTYKRIKAASLLTAIEKTIRAPKAGYNRGDYEWETESYQTEDHGVEELMDDRTIKIYTSEMSAEKIHAIRATNRVLQRLEYDIAAAVFDTATWTGADLTTEVDTPWGFAFSATPIDDIDAAAEKVKANCGRRANTLILSDTAAVRLTRTQQITDLIKYSGKDKPRLSLSALAELFQIERVLVGRGMQNTADRGQIATFGGIWDNTLAMVAFIDQEATPDLEGGMPIGIGHTFMCTSENAGVPGRQDTTPGLIVEELREEARRGGVMRARMDRQVKITHPECGHLLTAVTE